MESQHVCVAHVKLTVPVSYQSASAVFGVNSTRCLNNCMIHIILCIYRFATMLHVGVALAKLPIPKCLKIASGVSHLIFIILPSVLNLFHPSYNSMYSSSCDNLLWRLQNSQFWSHFGVSQLVLQQIPNVVNSFENHGNSMHSQTMLKVLGF